MPDLVLQRNRTSSLLLGQAVSCKVETKKHLSALLGDEMLALLGEKMFALIGDKTFARLGDETLSLFGDEMLAPHRDSARSNRDVARPTHNNDRRETPSKSKGYA
jgi:hypothetical protein